MAFSWAFFVAFLFSIRNRASKVTHGMAFIAIIKVVCISQVIIDLLVVFVEV